MRELDDITGAIVDASLRIHRDLGPGLLESVSEAVLARALERRDFASSGKCPFGSNTTAWYSRTDSAWISWWMTGSSWR